MTARLISADAALLTHDPKIDDPALHHDDDAVGEGEQFVEVLGDHQNPGAMVALCDQELLDRSHPGDVEATCRL